MRIRNAAGYRRFAGWMFLGVVLGLMLFSAPRTASAHCCREVASIRLLPVDPIATPRLRGRALILDCFGVISMLDVIVTGPVPDGTTFAPAIPGAEPILGDFFSMAARRGEGFIQNIALGQVQGRTVSVFDQNFTEVLNGAF